MNSDRNYSKVQTVEKTVAILETLYSMNGASAKELSDRLDFPESTVHRHLFTLEKKGYIIKEGKEYNIGTKFLELGVHTQNRKKGYVTIRNYIEELANETGERAQFIIEEHGQAVYLFTEQGDQGISLNITTGQRVPIHIPAAGKAILAHLPEERVDEIIEQRGLPQLTENTITDRDKLMERLAQIREQGYSLNLQEGVEGLQAIAVPVQSADDSVIGAISISGPTQRLKGERFEEKLPDYLLELANEIELQIRYA